MSTSESAQGVYATLARNIEKELATAKERGLLSFHLTAPCALSQAEGSKVNELLHNLESRDSRIAKIPFICNVTNASPSFFEIEVVVNL